ncbi:hypothetical protein ACFVU2_12200 [Leifsonia sp. NPDC058194]|uniref:TA system antitoxin ParD family protein n=1 Tax=Leifsonia sp. NPDC058194 TaxID=3346374 RepID=UPI0036D7C8E8
MGHTMPMRMDGDLFEAAKAVGAVASRSAAQQISHWARIGRELEASPGTSQRDIQRVLAGDAAYDDLGERGQAIVRAIWDEEMSKRLARLDLAAEFTQAGRSWTDADENGDAVVRDGTTGA